MQRARASEGELKDEDSSLYTVVEAEKCPPEKN